MESPTPYTKQNHTEPSHIERAYAQIEWQSNILTVRSLFASELALCYRGQCIKLKRVHISITFNNNVKVK